MSKITKKALAESLKKQMQTTPLAKITVNDIANDCGLNRRTLYYYFHDIYDLLKWSLKTELKEVLGKNKTYTTWQKGFLEILTYLNANKKIVLNIYNSIDRDCLENHLNKEICNLILEIVNELAKDLNVSDKDKKYVVKFYRIALLGTILDWIGNNMTEDPQEIIDNLNIIIDGDIYRALLKYEKKGKSN